MQARHGAILCLPEAVAGDELQVILEKPANQIWHHLPWIGAIRIHGHNHFSGSNLETCPVGSPIPFPSLEVNRGTLLFRQFRIATFSEPNTPSILRYTAGSVLMGFGGILAVGCTIGAGFTGGSVLALSSLIGLASMIAGAAVTDLVLQQIENGRFAQPQLQPGE